MKYFTQNIRKFAGYTLVITLVFRYFISAALRNHYYLSAILSAIIYGILIFIVGWIYGKKEKEFLPLYDIGFRLHLITYIICISISEAWFLLGFQSQYEKIISIHYCAIFWGIGLILHSLFFLKTRKKVINGLKKDEIFE